MGKLLEVLIGLIGFALLIIIGALWAVVVEFFEWVMRVTGGF